MDAVCCSDVHLIIEESYRLCAEFRHPKAKMILRHALANCIPDTPFSADIAFLLDALALACKEMEEFAEAGVYLAQSLAIKRMLFGDKHPEVEDSRRRLNFCTPKTMSELLSMTRADLPVGPMNCHSSIPVECIVTRKGRDQHYSVILPDDGRIGYLATTFELEPGQRVPVEVIGIYLGELRVRLAPYWAMEKQTELAFGDVVI